MFKWAASLGDERLVAEMVESVINSGVHSAARAVTDSVSKHAFGTNLVDSAASRSAEGETFGGSGDSALVLAGVSRLIAGAVLPMSAPPRLLMSPRREALDPYLPRRPRCHIRPDRPASRAHRHMVIQWGFGVLWRRRPVMRLMDGS